MRRTIFCGDFAMKKSLIALACGTFGLGMAEFLMMGILGEIARDVGVSIPEAGHFIAAYALGVCTGALILAFTVRGMPLKKILIGLVIIFIGGNLCVAAASGYWMMIAMRFISGLPHGAFFGVGSIVAEKIAPRGKQTEAVSIMIAGMTIANLIGIPAGTYMAQAVGWRETFMAVGAWGAVTLTAIIYWVPPLSGLPDKGLAAQFAFLKKPAPWLLLTAIMMGNGSVFCWYSYIDPLMTKVSGFAPQHMTALMALAGLGMVVGNLAGGKLSDRYSPQKVAAYLQLLTAAVLALIIFGAAYPAFSASLMFLGTACLFGLSAPQQVLIIDAAPGGEILGASGAQVAFNLGNALGAFCGGLPIEWGYNYNFAAVPGVGFAIIGWIMLVIFQRRYSMTLPAAQQRGDDKG